MTASGYYDDVFYCSVLQIEVPVRRVYVCRLFESGGFQGYFHNEGQCFIQQRLGLTNDLLPYHVYTMDDVNMEKIRSIKLYQTMRNSENCNEKKKNVTSRNIKGNKNSFYNTMSSIMPTIQSEKVKCLFVFGITLHNSQKFEANENKIENRHVICDNKEICSTLQPQIVKYRSKSTFSQSIRRCLLQQYPSVISLNDQFSIISSLSNHHRWDWPASSLQLKYEQRFSTSMKYYPGSPRNRIIQAWCYRNDPGNIIDACLNNLFGSKCEIPYSKKRSGEPYRKRYPVAVRSKQAATITPAIYPNLADDCGTNLYKYFCGELFRHNRLHWRLRNENKQVVAMGGYDIYSGDFMVTFSFS
ncbi:uncharacterized protein LOC130636098 [Hydractinia symbiolongicarpus]|uniref:uncharacterized protein LOC130636098 n=2 Tax=Hydractinia symbiolongicarpus TaxID=13093 RepID=UPI00254B6C84|nr:uncharacterized protein LOC130636098 [Hydractinia symbiolongicarpus]